MSDPPPRRAARAVGPRPRMSRFLRVLTTVTALAHVPVFVGVAEALRRLGVPWPWAFAFLYVVAGTYLFIGRASHGMWDHKRAGMAVWLVSVPYYVHWCACLFSIIPSVVYTLVAPIVTAVRGDVALPLGFYMWTYALGLVIAAYGVLVRRRFFRVEEVDVAIHGLDPQFEGYRIAHLSDLHIGSLTPREWAERWVRASNGCAPDLVVITGDLVTSGTDYHDDIAQVVGQLEGRDGVFVSMGNHDYFGEGEPLITMLGGRGAKVLRNEGVVLERSGAKMYLAAIDDTWTKRADLPRALEQRPPAMPTVLLAHDPDQFRAASKLGIELVLAGHTHGGQVAVPFLGRHLSLSHLTHHFHVGLYEKGRSKLYVHPGLGTTGPPIRLGVAPAVVILTLRAA